MQKVSIPPKARTTSPRSLLAVTLVEEPSLQFGGGGISPDPKEGIVLHGPSTVSEGGRHPADLSVGIIGTDADIENLSQWLAACRDPIPAKVDQPLLHPAFPGFGSHTPFQSEVIERDDWRTKIVTREIDHITHLHDPRARFDYAVDLLGDKIQLLADRHDPPRVIVIALPQEIIELCWAVHGASEPPSLTAVERRLLRKSRARHAVAHLKQFKREEVQQLAPEVKDQLVYRHFRRALKARAMRFNVPIQLAQPTLTKNTRQPMPTVAWNFFVALYYKAGGFPWILDRFDAGECFVGISFHRHVGELQSGIYSSLAQVFSNRSEGVVLRGEKFHWDEKLGMSPHLQQQDAVALVARVLREYERVHGRKPSRVILHKTSAYWPEELAGFKEALAQVADFDLIAVTQRATRLFREGEYPPVRGTHACIADSLHILYTMGYIPFVRGYPRGYVPDPLAIVDHHGQASPERICRELMALTKMNWNCADFATAAPITLRFARQVGEIMAEIPAGETPKSSFKFYM